MARFLSNFSHERKVLWERCSKHLLIKIISSRKGCFFSEHKLTAWWLEVRDYGCRLSVPRIYMMFSPTLTMQRVNTIWFKPLLIVSWCTRRLFFKWWARQKGETQPSFKITRIDWRVVVSLLFLNLKRVSIGVRVINHTALWYFYHHFTQQGLKRHYMVGCSLS